MNGKQARRMRQAARSILGPDAPWVDYDIIQQRSGGGGVCRPKVAVDDTGKQIFLKDEEGNDTEIPFILSMGVEARLKVESVKGMTKRIKRNYGKYQRKVAQTLDRARKLAQSK